MNLKQILGFLAVLPLVSMAQKNYDIKGKIGKLNKPAMAFLSYQVDGKRHLDSTYISNGRFEFKGSVNGPKEAHLRVKHDGKPDTNDPDQPMKYDVLPFYIENVTMEITATDSIGLANIEGSKLNAENIALNNSLAPYYKHYDDLNKEYHDKPEKEQNDPAFIASLDRRADSLGKVIVAYKTNYAITHPNSLTGLVALASTYSDKFDAVRADSIFQTFSPEVKNSDLGVLSASHIAEIKKTQEGVAATDIEQPDSLGKMVKLSDFKGKYVLVDFWASWCAPCRRENPNLVKNYAEYHSKGFEILGISLDKKEDRQKWLDAIHKDGLTWTQVSDLKGWDNAAAKAYNVQAIPMNYLLDPNGKIIAKYLRGQNLDDKLKEIFH